MIDKNAPSGCARCSGGSAAQTPGLLSQPSMPRTSARGFTLIELLLATTIGSIVIAAVYLTFNTALGSQRRIDRVVTETQQSRFFADRLRHDLRNVIAAADAFSGDAQTLILRVSSLQQKPRHIRYEQRKTAVGMEVLRHITEDKGTPFESVVYENTEKLSFRYLVDGNWTSNAASPRLPTAIECTLETDGQSQIFTINVEIENIERKP